MKIYSLLAIFGFFLGAIGSEISPDETASAIDSAPAVVETEEAEEVPKKAAPRGRRNRREQDTDSDDDTNSEDKPSDDSDM
jgi:hypothetical protein